MMAFVTATDASRRAEHVSEVLLIATAVLGLAGVSLTVAEWRDLVLADAFPNLGSALAGIVYALLGALIVRRAQNVIGWMLQFVGLMFAVISAGSGYAVLGIVTHPGQLAVPELTGSIAEWAFVASEIVLGYLLFFFPTGAIPSPRWRPVLIVGIAAGAVTTIGFVLNPVEYGVPAPGGAVRFLNPAGIRSLGDVVSTALVASVSVTVAVVAAALLSLVVRYRGGAPDLRQQIKWLAFAATSTLLLLLGAFVSLAVCGCDNSPIANVFFLAIAAILLFGVPAAIAIAILKYRLYEIDFIINRAVVYGLLAAVVTAIYVVVVVGFGTLVGYGVGSPILTTVAAVAIALLFQPLRRQAQRVANRLVYGNRATPYQVLSEFAEKMAGTFGLDDVLQRMAAILADGTGATRVDVWLRVGAELRPVTSWPVEAEARAPIPLVDPDPDELPPLETATRAAAVRHGDELLGALALEKPPNEPLTPTEDKLLQDLASQAGLVLRNVRLTAELQAKVVELRASRRRLVRAQDEERRKIERNLHDGAQQQLVALSVQLALLERLAEDPARVRDLASQLEGGVRDALEDLRDLARGIYPPLLANKGLAVALEAQARRAVVSTIVEPDRIGRYPRDVEAAVYFCALEAMQNVAKYAEATSATIRLSERDGALVFEIEDDGRGFDVATAGRGTGTQGMADRLDAIGGTLDIRSVPGRGTVVRGEINLPAVGAPSSSGSW
jgi:signal transduction histidine kinase